MDEPLFIPNKNIRDDDGEKIEDDVEMLRPGSSRPFSVNKRRNRIVFRIWFMPAVRLSSIQLLNPRNVDSITVWYIKPSSKTSKERPVVEVRSFQYAAVRYFSLQYTRRSVLC
jgi:hypothetical protein